MAKEGAQKCRERKRMSSSSGFWKTSLTCRMRGTLGELNPRSNPPLSNKDARRSEFAVSPGGLNQESDHNKHNDGGQAGHKPQQHTDAEEKQS
jgi:hypothetical protein